MRTPDRVIDSEGCIVGESSEARGAGSLLHLVAEVCEHLEAEPSPSLWVATDTEQRCWHLLGRSSDGQTNADDGSKDFWHGGLLAQRVAACVGLSSPVALAFGAPTWLDPATSTTHETPSPDRLTTLSVVAVGRGFELRALRAQAAVDGRRRRSEWLSWAPHEDGDARLRWLQTLLLCGLLSGTHPAKT